MSRYNIPTKDLPNCEIFWIEPGRCDVCHNDHYYTLFAEASGGEYSCYTICISCLFTIFAKITFNEIKTLTQAEEDIIKTAQLAVDNQALITQNSELQTALTEALNK